jgi:hypothetical protein
MPAFGRSDEEEEEDTLFDDVVRMADRLRLQGDKRSNYIDDHMTAAGYERIQSRESYARVQEQDEEDESGTSRWFGKSGGGRAQEGGRTGQRRPNSPRGNRDDGDSF